MKYWRRQLDLDRISIPRGRVHILTDRCKGCAFCVEYCPRDVLVMSQGFNRKGYHPPEVARDGTCLNCNLCEMICPEFAIFTVPEPSATGATPAAAPPGGEERP